MSLRILTEDQEKLLDTGRYEYTDNDINELACLASSIVSITKIMITHCLNQKNSIDHEVPIFSVIELLIEPISTFLNEGAPMKEGDAAEQEGAG